MMTLDHLIELQVSRVAVSCCACGHRAELQVDDLVQRLGRDQEVPLIARRCRCGSCGARGRDLESRPEWTSSARAPGVVTSHAGVEVTPAGPPGPWYGRRRRMKPLVRD